MRVIRNIAKVRDEINRLRSKKFTIGFVPTMGALHEGHLSLIRRARKENKIVIVSIFVNPLQFGPQEDFKKYPRNLKKDAFLCSKEGVDIIFCPSAKSMYPAGEKTRVIVESLSDAMCGRFRPGHFQGVTTVVSKLFNIVLPDIAYFGGKDAQQAIIIQKMVKDLNLAVKIKVMPTIREKNGLALSSRNAYLKSREKSDATFLFQSLRSARDLINKGIRDSGRIIREIKRITQKIKNSKIDYISVVDAVTLRPLKGISGTCIVAIAMWIGKTRLIDNIIVKPRRSY